MGWNDHLDDNELANLPSEAFLPFGGPVEFDDAWLRNADRDDQLIAVKEWFLARYRDPAYETPYNGCEGGFLFIYGGPYDPADVIHKRFGGVVEDDVIDGVVDDLYAEVGDRWAPINDEYDYDEHLDFKIQMREEPLLRLQQRLEHAQRVLLLDGDAVAKAFAEQLVFSSVITSLEAFLWETADYWVEHDDDMLRRLVTQHDALRNQQFKLADIFEKYGGLRKHVRGHLQHIVWHRWEDVAKVYRAAFDIKLPNLRALADAVEKRHHIVHRCGYDLNHQPVYVSATEIAELSKAVEAFALELAGSVNAQSKRLAEGEADGLE